MTSAKQNNEPSIGYTCDICNRHIELPYLSMRGPTPAICDNCLKILHLLIKDKDATVGIGSDTIMMPSRLTAENGAKYLLNGGFDEKCTIQCSDCFNLDEPNDSCEYCHGTGHITYNVPISWTTIKEIYKTIVTHFHPGK